jgi:hypothetical protein
MGRERESAVPGWSRPLLARAALQTDRSVAFQMAEVAVPRDLFKEILRLIAQLRPPPSPAWCGLYRR